jgi:uncharacterized protein (UPF0548 family)
VWTLTGGPSRCFERTVVVGHGDELWERLSAVVHHWGVKTRSGFTVEGGGARVVVGQDYWLHARLGPVDIREPVRVIAVVDQPRRVGFAYGTLEGHPVSGEEAFILERHGDEVRFTLRSVTAPGRGRWRWLFPVMLVAQRICRRRYLRAMRQPPGV